ncbi:hypothetical protein FHS35_004993 [Streptomyces umbrinus]|uniref:hypothetical protein n=1 Tax=Streptomyces umbrinus TaxID=67370 RepID=UPI00167E7FAF|nr:hypothetical protein [Streptomyces umbrinus]MCR3728118.1 hypothetical protein [Streptomyces umbrinus]GHH36268.1 hypothetical protein GCM10018775_12090 [Streptomyces umbrinus]
MGGVAEAGDLSLGEGGPDDAVIGGNGRAEGSPGALRSRHGRGTVGRLTVAATHPELLPLASCGLVAETEQ